jgi:DNA polymerase-1
MEHILDQCREHGFVQTILGRKRAIQGVRSAEDREGKARQRNLPERTAINTVIQGSAADLIKLAMIRVYQRLRREQPTARMLLQVHDELIFEAPADDIPALASLVVEEMSSVIDLDVPLKVDVKAGPNWAHCDNLPPPGNQ